VCEQKKLRIQTISLLCLLAQPSFEALSREIVFTEIDCLRESIWISQGSPILNGKAESSLIFVGT
ncbi:MAG: hypothetical protein PXY39_03270, partial [archaeon]|nr:hypothetical protein [archaeon]